MDDSDLPVPQDPAHPSRMRIGDADRHQVAEVLRRAAGEGRLDFEELDERLEATYAAKVYADLVPIVSDLPEAAVGVPAQPVPPAAVVEPGNHPTYDTSICVFGGVTRKGAWLVGEKHTAFALMGGVTIDLRQAVFGAPETVIMANAVMSGIDVIVNAHTKVIVDGVGIMGDFSQGRDRVEPQLDASSPVVRVKGIALMGAVGVSRRRMPGESRRGSRKGGQLPPSDPPPHLGHS